MYALFLLAANSSTGNSTGLTVNPAQANDLPGDGTLSNLASGLGHLGPAGLDSGCDRRGGDVGLWSFFPQLPTVL